MRLASWPQNLTESIALAAGIVPTPLLDTLVALLLAKTIMAASALGVFDALETAPQTAPEVARCCRSDAAATQKLLGALCACRYLKCIGNRFELRPVSRRWMCRNSPDSLRAAILHRSLDLRFMNFEEYVRHGKPQSFHGALSPEDWRLYRDGQASHAALILDEVLRHVPVAADATDLLDLGGGHGSYSFGFCRRYPSLRARVLDLAIATPEPDPADGRVEFRVADIRTVELPRDSADVILVASVVHHFDETTNRNLIQRAAIALRPRGIVVVIDAVRPRSVKKTGQLEGLLNLYFGAASGAGLWTIEDIQDWMKSANLELSSPKTMRRMPFCKMQIANKTTR